MRTSVFAAALFSASGALASVKTIDCNGHSYTYEALAGYGYVPSIAFDQYNDTLGGMGSAISIPKGSWKKTANGYTGVLWALPDRGWNTQGTLNYQNRVHKFQVTLTPDPSATVKNPSGQNVQLTYLESVLFTDPSGTYLSGIDGSNTGHLNFDGFVQLPRANYTGNGYGGTGSGGIAVPLDAEGLVVLGDGSFWVSDEYGPYVYHFDSQGKMIEAIRPPPAFIPRRNGTESFSADSPAIYQDESDDVDPANPDSGRDNNHGFEGLTISPDGKKLYTLLQAATIQDGGASSSTERYTRFLIYDISGAKPVYEAEYVVTLPLYDSDGEEKAAAQSEVHYISPTQFMILARDSNAGNGQSTTKSVYRHADIFDISKATNIMDTKFDRPKGAISPDGVLDSSITPVEYCSFLNYNNNSQLRRFGVHNGGPQNESLLNEKWESLALVPVNGDGEDGEFFLFSMSDNDFITQQGQLNFGTYDYADPSGLNLNSQVLVFQVKLPKGTKPY